MIGGSMKSVYSYTKDELVTYFEEMGEKKFKADQLFDWLYKKRVTDFSSMINLNKKVIANLENDMYIDNYKWNSNEELYTQKNENSKTNGLIRINNWNDIYKFITSLK